jgi:hypothetical protein
MACNPAQPRDSRVAASATTSYFRRVSKPAFDAALRLGKRTGYMNARFAPSSGIAMTNGSAGRAQQQRRAQMASGYLLVKSPGSFHHVIALVKHY